MSQLNELLSRLDVEEENHGNENDTSYFTAADDVSWIHRHSLEGIPTDNDLVESLDKTPKVESATRILSLTGDGAVNSSTPLSSVQNKTGVLQQKTEVLLTKSKAQEETQHYVSSNLSPVESTKPVETNAMRNIFQTKAQRIHKAIEESVVKSMEAFDKSFGIRIRNPKISSASFNTYVEGMQKIRPSALKPKQAPTGDWVTLGVIVGKSSFRKSSNNKDYLFLMLGDLMNCQSHPVKVLMFGDCVKEHWKVQISSAVALLSPSYADSDGSRSNGSDVVVKLTKPSQLLNLGICPDFAYCKGRKKDGENCRNFVNASVSERCVFHIEECARKFAARRGTFNSISVPPKKVDQSHGVNTDCGRLMVGPKRAAKPPAKLLSITDVKKGQKISSTKTTAVVLKNESQELNELLKSHADSLGARNLAKLQQKKNARETDVVASKGKSFKEFFGTEHKNEPKATELKPCLGRGISNGEVLLRSPLKKASSQQMAADAARKRAVELLRRKREKHTDDKGLLQKKARKRPTAFEKSSPGPSGLNEPETFGLLKKSKFCDADLKALLNKKSIHEKELQEEDQKREDAYFDHAEKKEKVETFVTSLMEVKDCNVVTCKKCNYTAQKQSEYCKIHGHSIVRHKADRRFYKCRSCSKRLICYELMPTKPCVKCGGKDFERVAMREERKIKLPEEELLLRGEERKYVNN